MALIRMGGKAEKMRENNRRKGEKRWIVLMCSLSLSLHLTTPCGREVTHTIIILFNANHHFNCNFYYLYDMIFEKYFIVPIIFLPLLCTIMCGYISVETNSWR